MQLPTAWKPSLARLARSRVALFALAALAAECWAYAAVRKAAGGPSVPLDDAFIHLQYARSIAEFRPFRYGSPADLPSSGATSVLYPTLLAVPHLLGFRGESLIPVAHLVGAAGWAAAAEGMFRAALRAWGPAAAWGGAALAFLCAGLAWSAGSCMETILAVAVTAWSFALALELDEERSRAAAMGLAVAGALAPWVRPELAALSALAAVTVAVRARGRDRLLALWPLAMVPALPLFWKLVTGTSRTTGATVKWALYDPYLTRAEVTTRVTAACKQMVTEVLAGHGWAVRYFPEGTHRVAAVGFALVVARAVVRRRWWSALVWLGALALLAVPATFIEWDTHRYRYLWAAFTMPLVCVAVAAAAVGAAVDRTRAWLVKGERSPAPAAALVGLVCGLFAWRVPDAVDDLADCGRAIRGQQVTLARRDVARLPPGARVMINDAGALAYLGGHRTIDLVGLTTLPLAEARAHGHGSTFEALEALAPADRPTHGAIYRGWFAIDPLLGDTIASATVDRHSILGGNTMELMPVRPGRFDTGAAPLDPLAPGERVADEVDVAWVPGERAHGYRCADARREGNLMREYDVPGRGPVVDGGRVVTREESMTLRAAAGRAARVVLRTDAWSDLALRVRWNGEDLEPRLAVQQAHRFVDVPFEVPAARVRGENRLEVALLDGGNYGSFHYWLVQR